MTTELARREPSDELVVPVQTEKIVEAIRRFDEFKSKVLSKEDYVLIQGRPFVKKSGMMKYALACQLSLEEKEEHVEERPDGSRIYHFVYRALAQNGRYAEAVGSASTNERKFQHPDHDARGLASTRACNRAISNLVAAGTVTAEEMGSELNGGEEAANSPQQPVQKETVTQSQLEVPDGPCGQVAGERPYHGELRRGAGSDRSGQALQRGRLCPHRQDAGGGAQGRPAGPRRQVEPCRPVKRTRPSSTASTSPSPTSAGRPSPRSSPSTTTS